MHCIYFSFCPFFFSAKTVYLQMEYYLIFNLSIGGLNLRYTKKQFYSQYIWLEMHMTRNMILYNDNNNEISPLTND